MKSLIFGGAGFVGAHLAEYLHETTDVTISDLRLGLDIRDYEQVRRVLDEIRPDYIYHLAAVTSVPEAIADPKRVIDVNINGTYHILEATRRLGLKTKILLASSTEAPVANNPYGMSKLAMEQLGGFYAKAYGMNVVSTRTCNHTGPGQQDAFAIPSFAKQVALIEVEAAEVLRHGNLDVWKNYLDVRDVVKAYQVAIDLPSDIYTISSSEPVMMTDIIDILTSQAKCEIALQPNPEIMRSYKQDKVAHRTSEMIEVLWQPRYTLEDTVRDTLDYWRREIL